VSENVIVLDEEKARRVMNEAERLSRQSALERNFWMKGSAERLGIPLQELKTLVEARVKEREKEEAAAKAEERRQEQRAEKQREREEKRNAAAERAEDRKRKSEQEAIDKAAKEKEKAKAKALADIAKLPVAQHETKLVQLATKLDLDLTELRAEFAELIAEDKESSEPALWDVEPAALPVSAAELLSALVSKIIKHVAVQPYEALVIALWVLMAWVHDVAATHSVFLVSTSAEAESGKSTALEVAFYMAPRPASGTEITAANLVRLVDRERPTLLVDEADDLFTAKSELTKVVNASWTKFAKIPKLVNIDGRWVTQWFSPFCPKAFGLIGLKLPRPLIGRSIIIKFWPKLPGVEVPFDHCDDAEFATLRSRCARWAADNGNALATAKPLQPAGFDNRLADNWRLLLAIAESAGETWAQQVRDAAERLARTRRKPSWRQMLLQTIAKMGADGREYVLSSALVAELTCDPTSPWNEYKGYRRVGKVNEWQVAELLEAIDVFPTNCGPQRLRGYLLADFAKAFAHFRVQSSHPLTSKTKQRKTKKQQKALRG
jgi:putative DNA primase/helicase